MADHEMNAVAFSGESAPRVAEQDHEVNEGNGLEQPPVEATGQTPPSEPSSGEQSPVAPPAPIRVPELELDVPHREQSADAFWRYARQFGFQSLLWIQFLWSLLTQVGSVAQSVSTGVLRSLQSQVYVFFQGSTYPYRLYDYTLTGPGVPAPEWFYDADKKIFYSSTVYNTTTEYELHHFEWLSGQIRYNNLSLYDVSDYLQQIKWAGTQRPSAAHVLAAWAIHSGVVLTLLDGITLSTINQDASESNVPVRG